MKSNLNLRRWYGVIAVVSIVIGLIAESVSRVYAENPNPGVIPPNTKAYGMTYGEWSAQWWQWAYSLPVDQNPWFDTAPPGAPTIDGCANGANGQRGPVWFLTGVRKGIFPNDTAIRNCTNLMDYRVQSPLFIYKLPKKGTNVLNAPPGSKSPAVADGYYLMLEPLSVGYHTIHFTGKLAIDSYYFSLDVTYNLTVARGHGVP